MEKRTGNEAPRAVAAATGRRTLCSRLENGFRSPHSVGIRVLFGGCPRSPPVTSRSIIARPRAVIICENLYMHGLIPAMWTSTSVLSLESGCKWELGDPDSGCSHRTDTKRLESASPLRQPKRSLAATTSVFRLVGFHSRCRVDSLGTTSRVDSSGKSGSAPVGHPLGVELGVCSTQIVCRCPESKW